MKNINLLNPTTYKHLWNYKEGKEFIINLINTINNTKNSSEEYNLLPFFSENLNNVRSYVIIEAKEKIIFIDFNFNNTDNLVKTDMLLINYLKLTMKKPIQLIIFNDFNGENTNIGNIIDIYKNDETYKYIFSKNYKEQLELNPKITKIIYEMTEQDYQIYLHEEKLKKQI